MFDDLPYGLECGEGWHSLIKETHEKLLYLDINYTIVQIKEKYGTLRYYFDSSSHNPIKTAIMHDVVRVAEDRSARTCEQCGAPAETRAEKHWYFTWCDNCYEEKWDR